MKSLPPVLDNILQKLFLILLYFFYLVWTEKQNRGKNLELAEIIKPHIPFLPIVESIPRQKNIKLG